jgi:fructose/tagatose bisphosphate aldolase
MPLATPAQYAELLDAAKADGYAIAAVNVTSSTTLNAAIWGRSAEQAMAARVVEACQQLGSAGRSLTAR